MKTRWGAVGKTQQGGLRRYDWSDLDERVEERVGDVPIIEKIEATSIEEDENLQV